MVTMLVACALQIIVTELRCRLCMLPPSRTIAGLHVKDDSGLTLCWCRYYSEEVHRAAFVLPAFAQQALQASLTS